MGEDSGKDHRYMVEDIVVTPFFKRHRKHMPATLKLHAEIRDEKDDIILETKIPGFTEEDVEVDVSHNSIDITLVLDSAEDGQEMKFHNSYVTPVPVDPATITIDHNKDVLTIKVKKK